MKKIILLLSVFGLLCYSCEYKTKNDRFNEIKNLYPKSIIIDVDPQEDNGWNFIVCDTLSDQYFFIECYANDEIKVKQFSIN